MPQAQASELVQRIERLARKKLGLAPRAQAEWQHDGKRYQAMLTLQRAKNGVELDHVIAEIKGSDLANEVVIFGAHLDSWNLGTGALDNGCNAATVIDTVRAIKAAGIHPRRTMRFILYSGEEEGMLGSLAYVRAHRNELDNVTAVYVLDAGDGVFTGFFNSGTQRCGCHAGSAASTFRELQSD